MVRSAVYRGIRFDPEILTPSEVKFLLDKIQKRSVCPTSFVRAGKACISSAERVRINMTKHANEIPCPEARKQYLKKSE